MGMVPLAVLVAALTPLVAGADSITQETDCDAAVLSTLPDNRLGTSFRMYSMYDYSGSSGFARSYVSFDATALVPDGYTVTSAYLQLYNAYTYLSAPGAMAVYQVPDSPGWTEAGITWNNQPGSTGPALDSLTFTESKPGTLDTADLGGYGWLSWDVTDAWDAVPRLDFVVAAPENASGFLNMGFCGRECEARYGLELAPRLQVNYEPKQAVTPELSSWALLACGGLFALSARRRKREG